jgi:hypothetical protein
MKSIKNLFFTGLIALAAVITIAGCATDGGGTPATEAMAAQLAADINAMKPESAEVNGATVTVTDRVEIETALTVPEGVTLDLTADGAALELRDGAVLTVNGTVNAAGHGDHGEGWVEGSLRTYDGTAVIAGTGTIYLKSKGRLLNTGGDRERRTLTLDGVTLAGLPDNDSSLVGIGENGEFVLKSGAITGNTRSSDDWASGGGVEVWRGTFTMEGGTISGNSANGKDGGGGGGVRIGEESVFTMSGGGINGNTAKGGGGVEVWRGMFTMTGGEISGNTVTEWDGGGVQVGENATFIMEDGEISGNTAAINGGGVVVQDNATFTMEGGTIKDNKADNCGGGVRISGGTFTMMGSEIHGNTAMRGGGVDDWNGTFTMAGGEIRGNTAAESGGGVWFGSKETKTFTKTGGTIYGDTDTTPGSTENTSLKGDGHAVGDGKRRNATAGPEVKLYARHENGVWTYNDTSVGGVGDTTANWE